jgi:predicted nucleic acid-binding protein
VIVIESSALVDALVGARVNAELLDLLGTEDLHAPALLDFEVASALHGHALAGKIGESRLGEALADFTALRVERFPMTDQLGSMIALRANFTVYAAAYVVLAQALRARLVTADAKLLEASRLGVDVHLVRPA